MNKTELVKILRPLIKECVKECLLEQTGILSQVVSECLKGCTNVLNENRNIVNSPVLKPRINEKEREQILRKKEEQAKEQRKKLLDAVGIPGVFEGTTPLKESPGMLVESSNGHEAIVPSPLAGISPEDPGVDVSSLLGGFSGKFKI